MDSCMLISILDVMESDPQSHFSKWRRINIGSAVIPMFSGRAVILVSGVATRRHSYSASLNNDTSLSSATHTLYTVGETGDRSSVTGSYLHSMNHLTEKMVASQRQVRLFIISASQLKVWTSSHRQWMTCLVASQSMSSKSGKLHPSDTNITKSAVNLNLLQTKIISQKTLTLKTLNTLSLSISVIIIY